MTLLKERVTRQASDTAQANTLRVFHEVARALTANLELEPLLRTILKKMEEFFGPEQWSLMMVDEEANELYYALYSGIDAEATRGLRIPLGSGVAGYVAQSGIPLVIPDIHANRDWAEFADANPELNLHSIACLPIRHGGRTLGVLQLYNSKLDLLPEGALSFLRVLCDYAAIALANARHVKLIHHLSITDDCTGLFNARYLYTLLEGEISERAPAARVVPVQQHFSLLFLDLDHFKSVNDTHGHLIGSRLLAEVGGVLKRVLGPEHHGVRYGGDEFVALLRGMDKPEATEFAQQVRDRLRENIFLSDAGLNLRLHASLGLATFPQDGADLHGIIRSADAMMYSAKARGRDQLAVMETGAPPVFPVPKTSRHSNA